MVPCDIPIVDFSPFLKEGDEDGKKNAMEVIRQACTEHGLFQIVNHGIPLDLMNQALEVTKTFLEFPDEEKLNCSNRSDLPLPAGYGCSAETSPEKYEYLMVCSPDSNCNLFSPNHPEIRKVLEELYCCISKTGLLMESILNECLGFPPNFFKEFNNDRSVDLMIAKHYLPAYDNDNVGFYEHQDGNCFTFLLQDQVGGLQAQINGDWFTVTPVEGAFVINLGDVIQVLSNDKFKSAMHRVVRTKGRKRYSIAYFYTLPGDNWIEPLPQFTREIGQEPLYRRFLYRDYQMQRARDKMNPPSRSEDFIDITHYKITTKG